MKTLATMFSGGGGFECGAVAAGFTPIWGVEYEPDIAGVYAANFGPHCIVARVEDVDYSRLAVPFHLHMSPVCKNASVAKKDGEEAPEDLSGAEACARAIHTLQPPSISLENVWGYRNFESFRLILKALQDAGYAFGYWHLNSADYGVPQTRKRLILLASKTHRPRRPLPTHSEHGPSEQQSLFGSPALRKWVGWYAAIEDLIPTLPVAKKNKRLKEPCEWDIEGGSCRDGICRGHFAKWQDDRLGEDIVGSFIAEATAAGVDNKFTMPVRAGDGPVFTVRPGPNIPRAFIVDGKNAGQEWAKGYRDESEPAFALCVDARPSAQPRAWLQHGRVVSMTPRALARFQSLLDSYVLPERNGLACRVIGNAVPSLLARRIVESVEGVRKEAAA